MARTNKKGGNTAGLKGWKAFSMENNSNNKPDGRAGSSAFQRTGDYDSRTGRRLSKVEADELIEEEGKEAVRSTYQDAIDRATSEEDKKIAKAKMAKLRESEEGKKLIDMDAAENKALEGTYEQGYDPESFGIVPDKREIVEEKLEKGYSAMRKLDPPETQAKIKKMIVSGIEKGMDDRDIMKKIRSMTDGSKEYTYNRKTKEVKVYPKGRSGFEGELETDPDKG